MNKLISLNKGIRRQPSVGADGELSECVNLIPRGGELVNVRGMEETGITLTDDDTYVDTYVGCIKTNMYRDVHIAYNDKTIKYVMTDKGADTVNFDKATEIEEKERIDRCLIMGNSLVYYCPTAKYLVLRGDSFVQFEDYVKDIDLTFGLQSEVVEKEEATIHRNANPQVGWEKAYLEESGMGAKVANFVSYLEKKGRFVNPFFVRYTFKMFDGSEKGQSSPVLMPCCNKYGAVAFMKHDWTEASTGIFNSTFHTRIRCFAHDLYYRLISEKNFDDIEDIVTGINIYICPIKFARDTTGNIVSDWSTYYLSSFSSDRIELVDSQNPFSERKLDNMVNGEAWTPTVYWDSEASYADIRECSTFFLLRTISLSDLRYAYTKVQPKDITTLTEAMTDAYYDQYKVSAKAIFSYNNRIFRGNIKSSYRRRVQLPVHVGSSSVYDDGRNTPGKEDDIWYVLLKVEQDNKVLYASCGTSRLMSGAYVPYLFFPNPDARELILVNTTQTNAYKIDLVEHPYLHGAYAYNKGATLLGITTDPVQASTSNDIGMVQPNVVQLSEEGNMFMYSPLNEFVVGDGEILAFSTATTALSEGQFGAFPVYVFCTDGIWVLEIAADGTVSSVKPVSRDVCNNPKSITQVDNAVVFTTDKGLMMLSGAEAVLLSDVLNGHNVKESDYWSAGQGGDKGFFEGQGEDKRFDALVQDETRDIRDILRSCTIAYDYANQLLRIFPEDDESGNPYKYYVFSLESREYATVISGEGVVSGVVAGYPSSMVQIGEKLYLPKERDDDEVKLGMLLTRPMTLDEPYALKKLMDLKLHYSKHDGTSRCKVMMHVSNDGYTWMRLTGLRKRSYKYYRFSIITKMKDMDALSGIVLRYDVERANRMR